MTFYRNNTTLVIICKFTNLVKNNEYYPFINLNANNKFNKRKLYQFFEKSHKQVNSSSVISKDDPSLMFVNAGMNQFKDIFLGYQKPEFKRAVNSQKCLRVSGKHNDLDQVGYDTYHHTFFEMLEIGLSVTMVKKKLLNMWEFVKICGLDKTRIYVTVFNGNNKDNISKDEETFDLWKSYLPDQNILFLIKMIIFGKWAI